MLSDTLCETSESNTLWAMNLVPAHSGWVDKLKVRKSPKERRNGGIQHVHRMPLILLMRSFTWKSHN